MPEPNASEVGQRDSIGEVDLCVLAVNLKATAIRQ